MVAASMNETLAVAAQAPGLATITGQRREQHRPCSVGKQACQNIISLNSHNCTTCRDLPSFNSTQWARCRGHKGAWNTFTFFSIPLIWGCKQGGWHCLLSNVACMEKLHERTPASMAVAVWRSWCMWG